MTEQDEPRPEDEAPEDEAPQEDAPAVEEPAAEADEPAAEEPTPEEPTPEEPTREEPDEVVAVSSDEPIADAPGSDESAADAQPDAGDEKPAAEPPADVPAEAEAPAGDAPAADRQRGGRRDRGGSQSEPEAIPGAHLEPDLVLEESAPRGEYGERSAAEIEAAEASFDGDDDQAAGDGEVGSEPAPVPTTILELAADARYRATGKRKSAVARVTLLPGTGVYTVNGRELDRFFPRPTLQRTARGPLETVGQQERMDVVATIHGGGVSAQAGALRHGVARALVEADPALRSELKRRGFLTRDPRVKERKKAGLKKARKRPQFSKR